MKEALTNLAWLCRDLGIEPDTVERCERMLDELPAYLVNEDGALKEWSWPGIEDRYDHRHVSHLYPVWPGHEISPEDTPGLFAAAKVAAQKRGRGNGSAHGLAHMALIGTRLKDAQLVYDNLLFMLRGDYLLSSRQQQVGNTGKNRRAASCLRIGSHSGLACCHRLA